MISVLATDPGIIKSLISGFQAEPKSIWLSLERLANPGCHAILQRSFFKQEKKSFPS